MFNLDEVDFDLNDEIFDDFKSKSSLSFNKSTENGTLSYGIERKETELDINILPKRICLGSQQHSSQISILNKVNDAENIKEFKEKFYSQTKSSQILGSKGNLSPTYSPITSTQKEISGSNLGYLYDRSNAISPIKMKPGICSELRKPPSNFLVDHNSFHSDFDSSKNRKFPGPAGHLPKVTNHHPQIIQSFPEIIRQPKVNITDNNNNNNNANNKQIKTTRDSCINEYGNSNDKNFVPATQIEDSESWKRAKEIIGRTCWAEFQRYTIEKVLEMVVRPDGLLNSKIPIICLVLTEIEYLPMDAAAKLSDQSGSIKCAIHRLVLENYNEKIKTGSVFILKKVSIFSPSGKKYYLNITKSNIIEIISSGESDWRINSQSVINKQEIDNIVRECSEIPQITFDPKSIFNEMKPQQAPMPTNNQQNPQSNAAQNKKEIDFFDDDMDEFLVSFMEESFVDQ